VTNIVRSNHWFLDISFFFIFIRTHCTCGWRSRPYWNMDRASDALLRHMKKAGTRIGP
jgi:hypothetical protein